MRKLHLDFISITNNFCDIILKWKLEKESYNRFNMARKFSCYVYKVVDRFRRTLS